MSGSRVAKRVVLYGITNQWIRKQVEIYLDDDCEIVGYSDSYLTEDIVQGKKFILPQQIKNYDIDVVIVCVQRDESYSEIRKLLADSGFCGRVVHARKYFDSVPLYTPNLREEAYKKKWDKSGSFKGVILGLSYSYRGIDSGKLDGDFYDFSWHSLDLYYNKKLFDDAMREWGNPPIDMWMMVIPYYYFDYDMSMYESHYESGQIYCVRDYGWHNGEWSSTLIKSYIEGDRLFGSKLLNIRKGKKMNWGVDLDSIGKKEVLDPIWYKNYEKTMEENINIFKEMLGRKGGVIVIPPLYLGNMSEEEKNIFYRKREGFYQILDRLNCSIPIYDCANLYNDARFFSDMSHLNHLGRLEFTKYINESVLRKAK